ncbi:MAG: hypothetical protein OEY44_03445 [Candidatus Peregrinibacteria bacterium]|nr:hypothetical protein [Candidatus Peregrinibacteria bacterium]
MPKRIGQDHYIPAQDLLHKYNPDLGRRDVYSTGAYQVGGGLRDITNLDACLNRTQAGMVEALINAAADAFNEGGNIDQLRLPIATFINSTRTDCENCLNAKCGRRDPETVVPK